MFAPPEPPRNLLTALTPELDAIVLRLLEKEPHDRYQDALEVQTALEAIRGKLSRTRADEIVRESRRFTLSMAHGPTQQRTIPVVPPPAPTRSAMPIIAGLVTVAVAAAAVIFVLTRNSDPPAKALAAPTAPAAPPVVKAVVEPRPDATPAEDVVTAPAPVEVKPAPRMEPKPRPAKPRTTRPKGACVTANGSPCEETL